MCYLVKLCTRRANRTLRRRSQHCQLRPVLQAHFSKRYVLGILLNLLAPEKQLLILGCDVGELLELCSQIGEGVVRLEGERMRCSPVGYIYL
jgi:hypothetical protein